VIQGIYRNSYIDIVSQGIPANKDAFMLEDSRIGCSLRFSPASEGIGFGKRVWYKSECCPSTIPVVGAMWFYERREISTVTQTERKIIPSPTPIIQKPDPVRTPEPPVPALW
jgi:hypothetical protein